MASLPDDAPGFLSVLTGILHFRQNRLLALITAAASVRRTRRSFGARAWRTSIERSSAGQCPSCRLPRVAAAAQIKAFAWFQVGLHVSGPEISRAVPKKSSERPIRRAGWKPFRGHAYPEGAPVDINAVNRNIEPPDVAYVTPAKPTSGNRREDNEVVSTWIARPPRL